MIINEEILNAVRNVRILYRKAFEEICRKYSVTQLQIDILLFLNNNTAYNTAKEICDCRGFAKSNVSNAVDDLVGREFIVRKEDESDRRIIRLFLTRNCESIIIEAVKARNDCISKITGTLTPEEVSTGAEILKKVMENINHFLAEETR